MASAPEPYAGVGERWADLSLGQLIRAARGSGRSQGRLAEDLGISEATVGAIERGDRVPGLDVLARLVTLATADPDAQVELLTRLLAKWAQRKVEAVGPGLAVRPLLDRAASGLVGTLSHRPLPPVYPRSLQGFPEQFQPLVGVFPDRREVPPDSPADLFIRSGAVTDFQYLPLLEGMADFTLCSDKFFVLMKEDWLRERYGGRHLLVVGSSGVNWLTRQLAGRALFRPLISPAWRGWDARYRALTDLDDHRMLGVFWRLLEQVQHSYDHKMRPEQLTEEMLGAEQHRRLPRAKELIVELLEGRTESAIVQQFRVPGFADPADGELHGRLPGDNNDFGVITLAPHPFDDSGRYVAIVCAGISGPGTAHGLKALLTEQKLFAAHPFGGVIKVNLPARENDWPGRFEHAGWMWQTQPYTPEKVMRRLQSARAAAIPADRRPAFQNWTDDELGAAIAFVDQLSRAS